MIQTLMNARLAHITVNRTATTLQDHIAALANLDTDYWLMEGVKVRNIDNHIVCICTACLEFDCGNIPIIVIKIIIHACMCVCVLV